MELIAKILIGFVALEHLYIMYFEMFAWETIGRKVFPFFPSELFTPTKGLAANQGLYNGFLVAGLVWSLLITDPIWAKNIATFFLCCVVAAGTYAGLTASKKILYSQALPAVIALLAVWFI